VKPFSAKLLAGLVALCALSAFPARAQTDVAVCSEDALIAALDLGTANKVIHLVNGGIPVKFTLFTIS